MFERTKTFWRRLLGKPASKVGRAGQQAEERRAWIRLSADLETSYKPAAAQDGTRLSARVRNISLGGVNLVVGRAFQPGEMISVALPGASEESHCDVLACVVHCGEEQPGAWSLGCTFSRELSDEDLEAFGARRE